MAAARTESAETPRPERLSTQGRTHQVRATRASFTELGSQRVRSYFVLSCSNAEAVTPSFRESLERLRTDLRNALHSLGALPPQ